jgi:tetratricopeptide (TPR) repeat protein
MLPPADTASLVPDRYTLAVVLTSADTTPEGAWKGTARSNPVVMSVLEEPAPMPPELKEEKMRVFSSFHLLRGEIEDAVRVIEAHLAEDPESIDGLAMKGEVAVERGNIPEAIRSYQKAIAVHSKRFPDSPEPPVGLYSRLRQLQEQLPPQNPPPPFQRLP